MAGLALGLARMGLELAYPTPRCGVPDRRPWLLADLHYLHFAVLLCAATGAVVVGGSLLTPPPPPNRVSSARGHPGPFTPNPFGRRHRRHLGLCPELGWGGGPGGFSHRISPGSSCGISPGGACRGSAPSPLWMAHPRDPGMVSVPWGVSHTGGIPGAPTAPCLSFPVVPCPHAPRLSVPGPCSATPALRDTTEPPVWAQVCNVNAVVLMCINIFCYAYFA